MYGVPLCVRHGATHWGGRANKTRSPASSVSSDSRIHFWNPYTVDWSAQYACAWNAQVQSIHRISNYEDYIPVKETDDTLKILHNGVTQCWGVIRPVKDWEVQRQRWTRNTCSGLLALQKERWQSGSWKDSVSGRMFGSGLTCSSTAHPYNFMPRMSLFPCC